MNTARSNLPQLEKPFDPMVREHRAVLADERRSELAMSAETNGALHVSLERNMKCAIGFCGHCQFGSHFICADGPVFPYARVEPLMRIREL